MYFKICGIKEIETIKCCLKNKVSFFGLIFYEKSPRFVNFKKASELINFSKNKNICPVGVFVNNEFKNIREMIINLKLEYVQLHGSEDDQYINNLKKNLKVKIIKSIALSSIKDLNLVRKYKNVDYFLFDYKAKSNDLPGGNAKSFDWRIINNLKIDKPWFISGGINESNIKNIAKFANPDGIDLSSGVEESPGVKNSEMIDTLFKKYYA